MGNKKTCNDCKYCGCIVDQGYDSEGHVIRPLQKYCPPEYLFNHPNPKECPNFREKSKLKHIEK